MLTPCPLSPVSRPKSSAPIALNVSNDETVAPNPSLPPRSKSRLLLAEADLLLAGE